MEKKSTEPNVYEVVTSQIIEQLEKGVVPWRKPWAGGMMPTNITTLKPYRGLNAFLMAMIGYRSPYWLTEKQAQPFGASVRAGEKPTKIVYWNWFNKSKKNNPDETKLIPFVKYFKVYNAEQFDNLRVKPELLFPDNNRISFNPIEKAEKIVKAMPNKPNIQFLKQRACYHPLEDWVNMPTPESFESSEAYYSTLFHELTHATGHSSRLNRDSLMSKLAHFGSHEYSKEELVAEMGAAFLSGESGIADHATIEMSASYIASWLKVLKNNSKLLIQAAGQAQKATDFILNRVFIKQENGSLL